MSLTQRLSVSVEFSFVEINFSYLQHKSSQWSVAEGAWNEHI